MLGLYLHIPFCSSICNYCNFNRGLFEAGLKDRYVAALEREIRSAAGGAADTIFFGGGTPSLLEPAEIARLVTACRETFDVARDAEITLETNPETSTRGPHGRLSRGGCEPRQLRRAVVSGIGAAAARPDPFGRSRARGSDRGARAPGSTTSAWIS